MFGQIGKAMTGMFGPQSKGPSMGARQPMMQQQRPMGPSPQMMNQRMPQMNPGFGAQRMPELPNGGGSVGAYNGPPPMMQTMNRGMMRPQVMPRMNQGGGIGPSMAMPWMMG